MVDTQIQRRWPRWRLRVCSCWYNQKWWCVLWAKWYLLLLSFISVPFSFFILPHCSSRWQEDLIALARNLNPIVGYFDPLELVDGNFWDGNQSSTIGFLRHSEIKHGRVAMAAFVGYCVQSNFHWPWAMTLDRQPFPSTTLCPQEQWDVLPLPAKLQILTFIGFLEFFSEYAQPVHYMKGEAGILSQPQGERSYSSSCLVQSLWPVWTQQQDDGITKGTSFNGGN